MFDDDFFRRFRRRGFPFFRSFEEYFDEMDRYLEEIFKDIQTRVPRDLVRERELSNGSRIREIGPFVYGYSVTVGPDGKPIIREFGNMKPTFRGREPLELSDKREPLVDIFEDRDSVKVVAEVPGVEKDDIRLDAEGRSLTISVDAARKYYKRVELPADVDIETAKATYKNGILEVTFSKQKPEEPKGKKIKID